MTIAEPGAGDSTVFVSGRPVPDPLAVAGGKENPELEGVPAGLLSADGVGMRGVVSLSGSGTVGVSGPGTVEAGGTSDFAAGSLSTAGSLGGSVGRSSSVIARRAIPNSKVIANSKDHGTCARRVMFLFLTSAG